TLDASAGWTRASGEVGSLQRVIRQVAAEREQLEAFTAQLLGRLQSVMAAVPVGIAFTRDQRYELVSAEVCRLVGRPERALLGRPARLTLASCDDSLELHADAQDGAAAPHAGEHELMHADGHRFWARLSARSVDPDDPSAGTIWTVSDVTADVQSRHALQW